MFVLTLLAALVMPTVAAAWCSPLAPKSLPQLEDWIARWFSDVRQRTPAEVARDPRTPVLLDVREPPEFAVSHLEGALRVSPDASLADLRALIGPKRRRAPVLFYCSVGYRSSRLADRVQAQLLADGAPEVASLRGGVFAWSNEGRPLVDAQGATRKVHPYDDCRAPLLNPAARSTSAR